MLNYYANRVERRNHAVEHTKRMNELYSNEIAESFAKSIIYGINAKKPELIESDNIPEVNIVKNDVVSALYDLPTNKKICVLNFASYTHPGGMFIDGSSAQEESICHESNLYNIISQFEPTFYAWNLSNKHKALYRDRAIYTPDVVFEHNGEKRTADVLTCAAPNYGAANKYQDVGHTENYLALSQRAKFVKQILETNNVEIAILGAWGTGVFRQDVNDVAELWKKLFKTSNIKKVVHPIIDQQTVDKFEEIYKR